MDGINKKIAIGAFWGFLELLLSRGASIIITMSLAAFLVPRDFGLVAIVAVIFELSAVMVNAGFLQALIRAEKVTDRQLSTAFWGNLVIAALIYVVVFFAASPIAYFFEEPVLESMIKVLGIGILVNALRIVQNAILSREMKFKPQMVAATAGVTLSGFIAIAMAKSGFGVWSLVAQMLSSQLIAVSILWKTTGWRPECVFDRQSFSDIFQFGKFLLVANVLNVIFKHSYSLVIAKLFSPELTGLYYFSVKVTELLSQQITNALQKATFPAMSTLQNENDELRGKYRQIIQLSMFVLAPIMLLLAAVAGPLFGLVFGERWDGAVVYTQILCIVGLLYPVHSLNINVLMVKGRTDLNLRLNLIKKAIQIVLLLISIPYGVVGIVIGQMLSSILALLPNTYYTAKLIDYGLKSQFLDIVKPVLSGGLAALGVWWIMQGLPQSTLLGFFFSCLVGIFLYVVASFIFRAEGAMMTLAILIKKTRR